jgi:thiol-disulfide isomerase/thioredoxin
MIMKLLWFAFVSSAVLMAQSFYVLTGVSSYDAIVANMSTKTQAYSADIKSLMKSMSKEIGVSTTGYSSRVLAFVIKDVSMGDVVGLQINLELGEYVLRKGTKQRVFGITYHDDKFIAPNFKESEDVDDQLSDVVEAMLERFKLQYKEDNKNISHTKMAVSHETFAADMGYETNYEIALSKAKKAKKDIMIFMTTSYCPWCRKLENRVLSQNDIDAKIKSKYIPLMLNLDKDTYPKQFAKTRFTPILYIVDKDEEMIVDKFVGYSSRGDFLQVLKDE